MKDEVREGDGYQDAQLINGHNNAGQAVFERTVIEKPGSSCGKPRKDDKEPTALINCLDTLLLAGNADHHPGHDQDNYSSQGSTEVGFDPANTDLAKDGCEGGKNCG